MKRSHGRVAGSLFLTAGAAIFLVFTTAAPAAADPEIDRKIAALRRLTTHSGMQPRAPRPGRVSQACGADRARRQVGADATLARLRAIHDASSRYGVSRNLIRSVIRHESAGNPAAVSRKGAQGLMQLMPATAKHLGVTCAFDPRQNILGGTRYLREMRNRFGSWRLALAAYNAGPTRVESGRRLPLETRRYVEDVLRTWKGS